MSERKNPSASAAEVPTVVKTWADLRTPGVKWGPRPHPEYPERATGSGGEISPELPARASSWGADGAASVARSNGVLPEPPARPAGGLLGWALDTLEALTS